MPDEVYLLWREAWDYDEQAELISAHATLGGAQAAHLDAAWPLAGPRGGKTKPRPVVTWAHPIWSKPGTPDPDYWHPDDDSQHGIERRAVHSAAPDRRRQRMTNPEQAREALLSAITAIAKKAEEAAPDAPTGAHDARRSLHELSVSADNLASAYVKLG